MFRIARFLFPKPARHAYPIGTGRKRSPAPVKTSAFMAARPRPDYTSCAGLAHVPTRDGLTAVIPAVGSAPAAAAPIDCDDATVSFDAVLPSTDPNFWYPELVPPPPSLTGSFDNPEDATPPELRAMRAGIPAAFGHSALTHKADPNEEWFRREAAAEENDRSLRAFHRRTAAWLAGGTATGPRGDVGHVLDTGIFTTVAAAQFGDDARSANGASR